MSKPTSSFRDFELAGWSDETVCEKYDSNFGAVTRQSVEALLDAAGAARGKRILDVCTGAGYAAGLAAARGAIATGVDFSAAQVKLARKHYPDATFQEGDGTALPFPAETFDGVINGIGIPHFSDPDAAVREAFRVLKKGGKFAFTVYDAPDRAIGFGAVYKAVEAHGTMNVGLPQGPNYFLFSDPGESARRLAAAGFGGIEIATRAQVWRVASVDDVIAAILEGSVRAAATLQAQAAEVMPKIRAAMAEMLGPHKVGIGYEIPMPVVLASAMKP